MNKTHFEKLQKMYSKANVNTQFYESTECKIELEKATVSLTISNKYFHGGGAIHGERKSHSELVTLLKVR